MVYKKEFNKCSYKCLGEFYTFPRSGQEEFILAEIGLQWEHVEHLLSSQILMIWYGMIYIM